MPRYLAVHTLPDATEQGFGELLRGNKPNYPVGVDWKLTYCAFEEHEFFCEWVAPDKATLQHVFDEQRVPVKAIYEVQLLDWETKTLD